MSRETELVEAFVHADLLCRVLWTHDMHYCGYVGIPASHPWHGKDYNVLEPSPDVHGGLTYSNEAVGPDFEETQPLGLWWIGFDCAHLGDYTVDRTSVYESVFGEQRHGWTSALVKGEVGRLAQIVAAAGKIPTDVV